MQMVDKTIFRTKKYILLSLPPLQASNKAHPNSTMTFKGLLPVFYYLLLKGYLGIGFLKRNYQIVAQRNAVTLILKIFPRNCWYKQYTKKKCQIKCYDIIPPLPLKPLHRQYCFLGAGPVAFMLEINRRRKYPYLKMDQPTVGKNPFVKKPLKNLNGKTA